MGEGGRGRHVSLEVPESALATVRGDGASKKKKGPLTEFRYQGGTQVRFDPVGGGNGRYPTKVTMSRVRKKHVSLLLFGGVGGGNKIFFSRGGGGGGGKSGRPKNRGANFTYLGTTR